MKENSKDLVSTIRDHVRRTFEDISEEFDGTRYKPWPETVSFLESVKKGSVVLDLGVGNGRNALFAVKRGLNVIGIDFSRSMVDLARTKFVDIGAGAGDVRAEYIQADLGGLPLKDGTIDSCISVATLHHVPSADARLKALGELYRVLAPGSTALVSVWDLDQERFKEELMRQLYGVCQARSKEGRGDGDGCRLPHPAAYEFGDVWVPWQSKSGRVSYRFYHLFYHNELVELVEKAGFMVEKYFRRADNHNAIIKKPD